LRLARNALAPQALRWVNSASLHVVSAWPRQGGYPAVSGRWMAGDQPNRSGAPMTLTATRLACMALLSIATASPCLAESLASSASSAGSASLGSLSESVKGSSRSSSGETQVAEGDYRVIAVVELADQPDRLRLKLQATARPGEAGELWLTLPRQALAQRALAAGDLVSARQRPYGVAFARADANEAFFLVLADDWHRDLDPHALTL
jgi:hypothetical protein